MTPLALPTGAELCIPQVAELREAWLQALAGVEPGQPVQAQVDASRLEAIDSAGIQLLLALKSLLERQGGELLLDRPNTLVLSALAVFGLDEQLCAGVPA